MYIIKLALFLLKRATSDLALLILPTYNAILGLPNTPAFMAQSFSFGFNDGDIESDTEEIGARGVQNMLVDSVGEEGTLLAPQLHTMAELVGDITVDLCHWFLCNFM